MAANGVSILSDDGRTATFNGDAAQAALNFVVKMVDQVYGSNDALQKWKKDSNFKMGGFAEGKFGLEENGNWIAWNIGQTTTHVPFALSGLPGGPNNSGKQYLPQLGVFNCIPAPATEPDPSWQYINFFASKDGQLITEQRSEDVPGNIGAAEDPTAMKAHYGRDQVLELFKDANALVYVRTPAYNDVNKALDKLSSDVISKKADVTSALQTATQSVQAALDAYWKGQG
jgi:ABC-type glycerol-3-phosphate transport system substrate-binding protein